MINDKQRRETEISRDLIMPGDVYEYRCNNYQGYGYMIPVKTSRGWDFIDTYHLGVPFRKDGETGDDASIRQIIELGHGEHDEYVSRVTSIFCHRNAHLARTAVPYGLRLMFNLNDYNAASSRECENYDGNDVVYYVPLYREQHHNWRSGRTLGLCFVRKDAEKNHINEFRSLLSEASSSIVEPRVSVADHLLGEVEKKLRELKGFGLSTQGDEDAVSRLAKRIEIINKCVEDPREIERERMVQLCDSGSSGEERTVDDEND